MLNKAIIIGRLTADPEVKQTVSGVAVTSFTAAVDRNVKGKDGQRLTDFLPVVAWRQTAEFIGKYFSKGSMICIVGQINQRTYEDRDGKKRSVVEITAEEVSFCGDKKKGSTQPDKTPENQQETATEQDLPF